MTKNITPCMGLLSSTRGTGGISKEPLRRARQGPHSMRSIMSTGDSGGVGFLKHKHYPPFDLPGVTKSLMTIIMGPAMGGRWKGEEAQREE